MSRRVRRSALLVGSAVVLGIAVWLVSSVVRHPAVPPRVSVQQLEDGAEAVVIEAGDVDLAELRREATTADRPGAVVTDGPTTWRLTTTVVVGRGARLDIASATLRLQSDAQRFVGLEARGGTIRTERVTITSWDAEAQRADGEPADGRAYVLATDGGRLDAMTSLFQMLGYEATDRHGVTWSRGAGGGARRSRSEGNFVGLSLARVSDVELSGITSEASLTQGVRVQASHHLELGPLVLRANRAEGAVLGRGTTKVRVTDVEATDNTGSAIAVTDRSDRVELDSIRLSGNGGSGVTVARSADVTIRDASVWGNDTGVRVDDGAADVLLADSRIAANRAAGLLISTESSAATVTTTRFDHNTVAGILVRGGHAVIGPGNRLERNDTGLRVDDETPDVLARDNVIADNAGAGVDLVVSRGMRLTGNQIVGNVAAPFAVRTPADSVGFAHVNVVLPSPRGWEVLRGDDEEPGAPPRPVTPPAVPSPRSP